MSRVEYTISTANSRLSKAWRNCSYTWERLCQRCRQVVRTPETAAQWAVMPKAERTTLKDVGGFVGGSLSSSRRSKGAVTSRSMLTLDFDEGVPEGIRERCYSLLRNVGYILHTTHSHTAENPRYRLILPLSRDVTAEEYEPLCRIILKQLDLLEAADISTYEPSRLMYWPSCPSDAEYLCDAYTGEGIDPDKHLSRYQDWRDCSQWPISQKEADTPRQRKDRAEDPTTKGGMVGEFCRIYSCEDVLGMLSDLYQPTTEERRYTYVPGSVYGGTLVYDGGKFVYNHNQTNPAHGLCNAFDLYRIHKYGELDKDARETDDPTKLPSYSAMVEHLTTDEEFLKKLTEEAQRRVCEDFGGADLSEFTPQTDGAETETEEKPKPFILKRTKKGEVENTIQNAMAVLEGDPMLKGKIRKNEFTRSLERGPVPWDRTPGEWTDEDDSYLRAYIERYGIKGTELVADAVSNVAKDNRYHPVRDYLDKLEWDGVERLDTLFIRFLGAEDTPIHRAMTRKQMVGAVKRIYEPGCKHDYCLVLSGPEGVGKSTMLRHLALTRYFNDSIVSIEGKDAIECLQGSWIVEFAELTGLNKSEVEMLKAFLTKCVDKIRKAYGRRTESFPRQCVFFGTTNEDHFLRGDRGNRRFWVIVINPTLRRVPESEWLKILDEELPQIWAEAKYRYQQGENNWLEPELEKVARQMQEEFNESVDDPLEEMLSNMLDTFIPQDWCDYNLSARRRYWQDPESTEFKNVPKMKRKRFCIAEYLREVECLEFGAPLYKSRARKVGELMRKKFSSEWDCIGVSRKVSGIHGTAQKAWERKGLNLGEDRL